MAKAHEVLTPDEHLIYTICLGVISSFGFVSNILFIVTIFVRGLESILTTYLVRSQAIIDTLICFVTICFVIFPKTLITGNITFDVTFCRLWSSQAIVWWLVSSGVYNLVFTAFDRYWAVLTPQTYKQNIKRKLYTAYSVIIGMCGFITLPSFLQSRYDNGSCTEELQFSGPVVTNIFKVYSLLWFVFIYGVPSTIMIYIYTRVIWHFHHSIQGDSGQQMKSAMRSFTKGSIIATGIFLITIAYDAFYYMLGNLGIVVYKFNTPIQLAGVFLTSVNSSVNPMVFFVLVKTFRRTFVSVWCRCIVGRVNTNIFSNQVGNTTTQ